MGVRVWGVLECWLLNASLHYSIQSLASERETHMNHAFSTDEDVGPVAYLYLGYAERFESQPDETAGWLNRLSLQKGIAYESWENRKSL